MEVLSVRRCLGRPGEAAEFFLHEVLVPGVQDAARHENLQAHQHQRGSLHARVFRQVKLSNKKNETGASDETSKTPHYIAHRDPYFQRHGHYPSTRRILDPGSKVQVLQPQRSKITARGKCIPGEGNFVLDNISFAVALIRSFQNLETYLCRRSFLSL